MKILEVEAEMLRADGRTDIKKLTAIFCNFLTHLKNIARLSVPEYTESKLPSANWNTICYQHSCTVLVLLLPPFQLPRDYLSPLKICTGKSSCHFSCF